MELCGDVVQSLSEYLGLEDLQAQCDFPNEVNRLNFQILFFFHAQVFQISRLESLLEKADELQSVRQRLSAELADNSGLIRTLVVRAEDARLMMDM